MFDSLLFDSLRRHCAARNLPRAAIFCRQVIHTALLLGLFATVIGIRGVGADDWLPVSQDELKMTSLPEAPGAPAVVLYRQVDRDDNAKTGNEQDYVRIKILTEEGRKYADVEIPHFHDQGNIIAIRARTVRPDGSIVSFDGKAYDKTIVKARGLKYLAKTFTLPDVQVGSIIEYRYTYDMTENYVYNSHWILSDELFTRHAKFSLKPNRDFALRWSWPVGLPQGTTLPKQEPATGIVRMEVQNIPAFQVEDFMPRREPTEVSRGIRIQRERSYEPNPTSSGGNAGQKLNGKVEGFLNKRKAMEQQWRKSSRRTMRPRSRRRRSTRECRRCATLRTNGKDRARAETGKAKSDRNAEELLRQGFGNGRDITWLVSRLVRLRGSRRTLSNFDAAASIYFTRKMMNA